MPRHCFALVFIALGLAACGDSGSSGGGAQPPPPPPTTSDIDITLDALQVTRGGAATGAATASLSIDPANRSLAGTLTLSGVDAEAVALRYGFAGEVGPAIVALSQDSAQQWSVPLNTVLGQTDFDRLNAGGLYMEVVTADNPEGALRGQLLIGNISVYPVMLSGYQEVPPLDSDGAATGFVTFNADTGAIVVHVNTRNLDDAVMAHVHRAGAGTNGPVLIGLTPDPEDAAHWLAEDESLDGDGRAALNAGELYINVHTPANLPGEVRGQIVPAGVELIITRLTGDEVVMGGATTAFAVAATTVDANSATFHVNTVDLDAATGVSVNQAPVGQNGPAIVNLNRDATDLFRWSAADVSLSAAQLAALRGQGLYFTVLTPAYPGGEVRGQLIPENSNAGGDGALQVTVINPAAGADLTALPGAIEITFNRDLLPASVSNDVVFLSASGGDGSFGEDNDVPVTGFTATAGGALLTVDLSGIVVDDDVFRISLADNRITDPAGAILDGDADGSPGGVFASAFTVAAAPPVTFSFIQTNVFNVSCASSSCHGGAMPAAGQNLTEGQAFANIVGVPSRQMPALDRIEPGDPENSYLIRKIEGRAGSRMPLGGAPLSPGIIDAMRQWVAEGALNN